MRGKKSSLNDDNYSYFIQVKFITIQKISRFIEKIVMEKLIKRLKVVLKSI